jgi:hypothetical protein
MKHLVERLQAADWDVRLIALGPPSEFQGGRASSRTTYTACIPHCDMSARVSPAAMGQEGSRATFFCDREWPIPRHNHDQALAVTSLSVGGGRWRSRHIPCHIR